MAVLSPDEKEKKLCKIRRKFYEEKCHVGFLAEKRVSGLVRERTIREKLTSDAGVGTVELLDVWTVLKYRNVTWDFSRNDL